MAIIDADDAKKVYRYNWQVSIDRCGVRHAITTLRPGGGSKTTLYLHSLILKTLDEMVVDHIDGDGLNNLRSNLRPATSAQNVHNARKRSDGSTGFKGVGRRDNGRYTAVITLNKKDKFLGSYDLAEEAAHAYDDAARKMFGEFARVNFPREGEQQA